MKSLVLCSGGLDSTVLLHSVVQKYGATNVIGLSIYYGQKHAIEHEYAVWQCNRLGIQLLEADLSQVFKYNVNSSALLEGSALDISHKSYAKQLEDLGGSGTVSAYVPYRNGLFLSYATAIAFQLDCCIVYYGAHADDAAGSAYPDCTAAFIEAQGNAIYEGTAKKVELAAPWWCKNKADIVAVGIRLGMSHDDFKHTWSCYEGLEQPCGTCGTCLDRIAAFQLNGIQDIV